MLTSGLRRKNQVKHFKYFRRIISYDGRCKREINSGIVQTKEAFNNKSNLPVFTLDHACNQKLYMECRIKECAI